jgi:hypothetical protein
MQLVFLFAKASHIFNNYMALVMKPLGETLDYEFHEMLLTLFFPHFPISLILLIDQ